MEFLDVVDRNDEVIEKASKREIYQKKLCHRIVHVLIFNDEGKMALQLRSNKMYFCPNHWSTTAGGHVKSGESYEEAALREYKEELGAVSNIKKFSKDYYEAIIGPKIKKFMVTFKSKFNGPFHPDIEEVKEIRFFSIEEIKKMLKSGEKFHPELLFLLRKYFF